MTETISHFGLHSAESDIWFLEQDVSSNALGITLTSPFKHPRPRNCNHRLRIVNDSREYNVPDNPLIVEMLPIPKRGDHVPYFIGSHNHTKVIYKLCSMTSPIDTGEVVRPVWTKSIHRTVDDLKTSNIQPLVLTGVTVEHTRFVKRLAEASVSLPRRIIFVGEDTVVPYPPLRKINLSGVDEVPEYDWEDFGGWFIGKWMRGEVNAETIPDTGRSIRN